jgi:hypothetical protein
MALKKIEEEEGKKKRIWQVLRKGRRTRRGRQSRLRRRKGIIGKDDDE